MEDPSLVAIGYPSNDLVQIVLDDARIRVEIRGGFHQFLQVQVEELKDEVQSLFLVEDVIELDDVVVVELL